MSTLASAAITDWPPEDLEFLDKCPVCASAERQVVYSDLEDWSFRAADGKWKIWKCTDCAASYLDPRPSPASIGRAYAKYYTHEQVSCSADDGSKTTPQIYQRSPLKTALRNGYLSVRFGHKTHRQRYAVGALIYLLKRDLRLNTDLTVRHLPAPTRPAAKVLDIGCGSGAFLSEAQDLGFLAQGIDPDPKAVESARNRGLDVREGGFPSLDFASGTFDHVTLSHVIEHLHDPVDALVEIKRILTPGGRVWISTPNMASATLAVFGKHWRGLEAPRHLVIFNPATLNKALLDAGFVDIESHVHPPCAEFFVRQSTDQQADVLPYQNDNATLSHESTQLIGKLNRIGQRNPDQADILIMTANRPR